MNVEKQQTFQWTPGNDHMEQVTSITGWRLQATFLLSARNYRNDIPWEKGGYRLLAAGALIALRQFNLMTMAWLCESKKFFSLNGLIEMPHATEEFYEIIIIIHGKFSKSE